MLTLVTAFSFIVVVTLVLSGYYVVTAESPLEQRVRSLVPEPAAQPQKQKAGRFGRFLRPLLASLGQYGLGGNEASLRQTLSVAGIRGTNATALFVGLRTALGLGPALLVLVPRISSGMPLGTTLLYAGLAWAAGHILANLLLKRRAGIRARLVSEALPDALDLMVVCLEAGLSLTATIARVGAERSKMDDPLGQEFEQLALELREGRSREGALRAFGDRNGVEDLKALAALIIQSDRLGASMGKTLRAHADVMRTKRRQRAEEETRKLPIKILFPLALFILPSLFVVVLGPAFLHLAHFVKEITPALKR